MANLKQRRDGGVLHCVRTDCTFAGRLWQRMRWWRGAIYLDGMRYCAPRCFEDAARQRFARICDTLPVLKPVQHRVPLGLIMLSRGELSRGQLLAALEAQRANACRRIGEWLAELGFASEQQVTSALALQWACPVLTTPIIPDSRCVRLIPFRILESYRILPLQFVEPTRTFYLAFADGIDYAVLGAVEHVLRCRTEACLVQGSVMDRALEQIGRDRIGGDLLFEGWRQAAEMARITSSYRLKLEAAEARVAACGRYIWARLSREHDVANLIFRHPGSPQQSSPPAFDQSFAGQANG
jgi:hypothetical protein